MVVEGGMHCMVTDGGIVEGRQKKGGWWGDKNEGIHV